MFKIFSAGLAIILILFGLPNLESKNITKAKLLIADVSKEPELETYTTDMKAYLRTYYQLRAGKPYYESLGKSVVGDATRDNLPGEIWGWKLPFIFYFWSLLPGPSGVGVYVIFIFLLSATLFASFKLSQRIIGKYALFSPYLLVGYFILPLTEITIFQVEWWAVCFFIIALAFLVYDRKLFAGMFFMTSIFTRELFVFHLAMLALVCFLLRRRRYLLPLVIPPILLILFYSFYHLGQVYRFENFGPLTTWWRQGIDRGWHLVRPTLSFSSQNYFFFFLHPFRFFLLFATIGLLSLLIKNKDKLLPLLALFSFLPFFLFIFFFGIQTKWQDYWGIYYLPLAIIFAPTILTLFPYAKK